jgi:hypothetical protein
MQIKSILTLLAFSILSCSPKKAAESSKVVEGTKAERIARVGKIISPNLAPPGPLLDANFVEEQMGDGNLGPSDFKSFCVLKVAPADLPAWKAVLAPLEAQNNPPTYVSPKQACPWWLSSADFAGLEFRSPKSLSGRLNGWCGIASDGRIFVFSFTM